VTIFFRERIDPDSF